MATINQPPRLQLGDAPLVGYGGETSDQFALIWQTIGELSDDRFIVEYRPLGSIDWSRAESPLQINTGVESRINHSVTITGLDYNTDYEYRVQHWQADDIIQSFQQTIHTRLAAGDTQSFSFATYGDSADPRDIGGFQMVQDRINIIDPDFSILLGDNAYPNGSHAQYDYRFTPELAPEAVDWADSRIDYSAYGNHDSETDNGQPYRDSYEFPIPIAGVDSPSAPPGGTVPELNYSFDYGNAHFVTFDSNKLNDPAALNQLLTYVEADLAATKAKWKIVFAHHPVGGAPDNPEGPKTNYFQQVVTRLKNAGVDLLLVGHSHSFGWTFPLTGYQGDNATFVEDLDKLYDKGAGLVQAVVGNGGAPLRPGSYDYPYVASGYSLSTAIPVEDGFAHVSVTDSALTLDYVAADDGAIIDSFMIVDNGTPDPLQRITFQQGVDGYAGTQDTYLQQASPNTNNGAVSFVNVDNLDAGGPVQGLLRFDNLFGTQTSQIPLYADIQSARLELNVFNPGDSLKLYPMLQSWSEDSTWNLLTDGIQVNDIEASSSPIATTGPVNIGLLSLDVTESLKSWQANPTQNLGWAILPTGDNGVDFYSSEGVGAPKLVVDFKKPKQPSTLFFSLNTGARIAGKYYRDEDIIAFDGTNFSRLFDGSDVGLGAYNINSIDVNGNEIYMSFTSEATLMINGQATLIDDSDIVKFTATQLGNNTKGSFELVFDGSDVGLETNGEKVDGLDVLSDGSFLISTNGPNNALGKLSLDEDVLKFSPVSLGAVTTGTWSRYFDGSDVGLAESKGEDLQSLAVSATGDLYFSTLGIANVPGVTGMNEDVLRFTPTSLGDNTAGSYDSNLFFDGSLYGLSPKNINALDIA